MFKSIVHGADRVLEKMALVAVILGGVMTLAMVLVTSYGVVMRYFFRRPEPISYELATIFMLWAFLLGLSFVEWRGEHIRADIFTPYMPKAVVRFLHTIVAHILALVYAVILAWKGWSVAMYSYSIGERSMSVWQEPLFPIKVMVPIGYALLTLVIVRNLIKGIASYSSEDEAVQGK
jgi:TRAP-type C4-dicarboxylate transport system permease small subunit